MKRYGPWGLLQSNLVGEHRQVAGVRNESTTDDSPVLGLADAQMGHILKYTVDV
jgi:hypothetical protein